MASATKDLHDAIGSNNELGAMEALENGADPNEVDARGMNALHLAARHGCRLGLFNLILSMIHNVNAVRDGGFTALMIAVNFNHLDMVVSLMNRTGINVNVQSVNNRTALHLAVLNNRPAILAQLLRDYRVDTSLKDLSNSTPLKWAIDLGRPECAKILREHEATERLRESLRSKNELGALKALKDGADPNKRSGFYRWNALHLAARHGCSLDLFGEILAGIDDVNALGEYQETALIISAHNGQTEIAEMLIAHPRIDVNVRSNGGYTALMVAIERCQTKIAEMLIAHPLIDVNVKNSNYGDKPALHYAILTSNPVPVPPAFPSGKVFIVNLLLNHPNIDANAQDGRGKTALHYAALKATEESGFRAFIPMSLEDLKTNRKKQAGAIGGVGSFVIVFICLILLVVIASKGGRRGVKR